MFDPVKEAPRRKKNFIRRSHWRGAKLVKTQQKNFLLTEFKNLNAVTDALKWKGGYVEK
jgi:hypothetical protein